jgi:uncharacterized protein with PIN domain
LLEELDQAIAGGASAEAAFAAIYSRTRDRVIEQLVAARAGRHLRTVDLMVERLPSAARRLQTLLESELADPPAESSPDFECDAALGGLARWLRAAGYQAQWWPGIADDALVRNMHRSAAIMLTTDRRLAARGVIDGGVLAGLLVPVALNKDQQFQYVMRQLGLPRRPPRCMACGGVLQPMEKEAHREAIPPRTYAWLDEYYRCVDCGKLYWEGTHWQRIESLLEDVERPDRSSA